MEIEELKKICVKCYRITYERNLGQYKEEYEAYVESEKENREEISSKFPEVKKNFPPIISFKEYCKRYKVGEKLIRKAKTKKELLNVMIGLEEIDTEKERVLLIVLRKIEEGITSLKKIMYSKEIEKSNLPDGLFFGLYEWTRKIVEIPKEDRKKCLELLDKVVSASDKRIEFWKRTIV